MTMTETTSPLAPAGPITWLPEGYGLRPAAELALRALDHARAGA